MDRAEEHDSVDFAVEELVEISTELFALGAMEESGNDAESVGRVTSTAPSRESTSVAASE